MILSKHVLLIIDMQQGLFHSPVSPYQADVLLTNVRLLIEKARQAEIPVFFARHTGPDDSPFPAQSSLTQLLPEMGVSGERDIVFIRRYPSCFQHTDFAHRLAQVSVKQLVIAGMKTEFCVNTTYRTASALGQRTVLISDAHPTTDNKRLSMPDIIGHHSITLTGPFVSLSIAAERHFSARKQG